MRCQPCRLPHDLGSARNSATDAVNALIDAINSIPDIPGGGRAAGGPVAAGRAYLVGERGPEMFIPTTSGVRSLNLATAVGIGGYEVVRRIAQDQRFLHAAAGYGGQKGALG